MSLSPVFLLYDLPGDEITSAWAAGPGVGPPATTVSDDVGTVTRLWPVSDPEILGTVGPEPGVRSVHHRRRPPPLRDRSPLS